MTYTINGKTYIQKALVLGQLTQLTTILQKLVIGVANPAALMLAAGPLLPDLLAVMVAPEGVKIKDKNIEEITDDMFECDPETAVQVIEDFFVCNPIASLLNRLAMLVQNVKEKKPATP